MFDRSSLLRTGGAATFGALALTAIAGGTDLATAAARNPGLLGDPSQDPTAQEPSPEHLTHQERLHLKTFDETGLGCRSSSSSHTEAQQTTSPTSSYTAIESRSARTAW